MARQGMRFGADDIWRLYKAHLGAASPDVLRQQRVAEVRHRWKVAVEAVYKGSAQLVLEHTNAVYIMRPEDTDDKMASRVSAGGTLLLVYSDDAMVRSDIDARQEFLKMSLNEQGEHVEAVSIKASRQGMKTRHPFKSMSAAPEGAGSKGESRAEPTMDAALSAELSKRAEAIENKKLREAIQKALQANTKPIPSLDKKNDQ